MEMLGSRAFLSWQATVNKFQPTTRRQNKTEDTSLEDCFIFFPRRNDHVLKGLLVAWKDCWLPADAGGLKETCWVLVWCLPESLLQEMPLAIIRYILHFGQSLPTFFLQRARSPLLISVQRTTFLQWHCVFRDENARLRKCPAEEQVECHSGALHRGALEMPGAPQKSKVCEKLATIAESQRKPNDMPCSHSFPPGPSRVLWMTAKGIWKK